MALEFKLPDIGEGIAEGEIVKWLVSVGDTVAEHQPVVEVMTDKATVEIPAPQAGKITAIRAKEGDVVPVGSVLFVLEAAGDARQPTPSQAAPPQAASSQAPRAAAPSRPATPPSEPAFQQTPPSGAAKTAPTQPAPAKPAPAAPAPAPRPASSSAGKTIAFKLPDIGEGIAEGEIVRWLVKEGETVAEHQPIVEVMTDKATVEIPAPATGTIQAIHVQPGAVVPIGTVLFDLSTSEKAVPAPAAPAAPAQAEQPEQVEEQVTAGAKAAPAAAASAPRSPNATRGNGNVRAVPSARRAARELGVDLGEVSGTGRGGIIRRADVEAFQRAPAAPAATPSREIPPPLPARPTFAPVTVPAGQRETRRPFRGVRRKIAEAMTRSKFTATHFTVVEELDVTELVKTREAAKKVGEAQGIKVTYMPFMMKATALALARHPELNGTLDETKQEIVTFHYVNLGIATDTPNGLIVPVIREVQTKGLLQLASELNALVERTRTGKVKPEELQGGTFTITNAGNIGGILATPIINFPEIGVLGVHRIMKRPGVAETSQGDKIEVRQYMNLSVSVDHRLTDGANAARFLVTMKQLLENPGLLAL